MPRQTLRRTMPLSPLPRTLLSAAVVLLSTTWSHASDDIVFTVRRGACFVLPDGGEFSIHSVGQKRPMAGGPPSPLLVGVTFRKDTLFEDSQLSLHPDRDEISHAPWTWGGWNFQLLDYESNRSLTLRAWKGATTRPGRPQGRSAKN